MKKIKLILSVLSIVLAFVSTKANAQDQDISIDAVDPSKVKASPDKIYFAVEQEHEFKGGKVAFYNYLKNSIRYPAKAVENHTQGKVFVSFIVEKDGSLSNLKVVKGVSGELDAEALRVLKNSPNWNPGTQNGIIVRVFYTVPISFVLSRD